MLTGLPFWISGPGAPMYQRCVILSIRDAGLRGEHSWPESLTKAENVRNLMER